MKTGSQKMLRVCFVIFTMMGLIGLFLLAEISFLELPREKKDLKDRTKVIQEEVDTSSEDLAMLNELLISEHENLNSIYQELYAKYQSLTEGELSAAEAQTGERTDSDTSVSDTEAQAGESTDSQDDAQPETPPSDGSSSDLQEH